jgi:hypothetical protein
MKQRSPDALQELADWYRAFPERAGNPTIWESRLRRAEELEEEAARDKVGISQRTAGLFLA